MARVVWIAWIADWRGAGVPVAVSRDLFLDFVVEGVVLTWD